MRKNPEKVHMLSSEILKHTIVIIPAFNEEKNIVGIIRGIKKDYPDADVVVIDDGSFDRTCEIAVKSGAIVLSHPNNMGYGVALQTGYKYALRQNKYQYLVQLDGDGQHNYKDIRKLLEPLVQGREDLVIGSRFLGSGNGYAINPVRRLGMLFFRILLYALTRKKIKDVTSGMQAFKRGVIKAYVSDDFPYYYPDANVLLLQLRDGFRVLEVPSAMTENKDRKSMHGGIGRQLFYVISMILSIFVILFREIGGKHAR